MRWLVGDVQGCREELEELLETIRFRPGADELWCLGDLINRGPDSLGVLRLWREIGGRALLGNHDIAALLTHSGTRPRRMPDLDALFSAPDVAELLEALRGLPILVHLPAGGRGPAAWIVHAGLAPSWHDLPALAERVNAGPHDDDWLMSPEVGFATRVRCCTPEGEPCRPTGPPSECPPPCRPWDDFYRGAELVVHGHWAARGHYRTARTLGLDSGCVYGGALTAWCQDEDRIVQVPSRQPKIAS